MKSSEKPKTRLHLSEMDPKELLLGEDVKSILKISRQTLYRRRKEGMIEGVQAKRNIKYEVGEVLAYIEKHRKVLP